MMIIVGYFLKSASAFSSNIPIGSDATSQPVMLVTVTGTFL